MVDSLWTDVMDSYTPDCQSAQKFIDHMVDTYVCQESSCYSIEIWNVYRNIRNKLPRANNSLEGCNFRIFTIFAHHPHIHDFPCRENRRDFPDFLKNWRKIVIYRISLKDRRYIRFYRDYVRKADFQKSSINHDNYSFTVLL